ncbi:uncharacterized protein OCT59_024758 [Rhizophagus irregularis]|uniref:uncharacterized protein n=1 Tax=Rhizophagus irregularis TaxID=588596 RepID=UPI0019EB7C9E|nr:hypothetical protein OCT59_024758 [Rhizophagus irregularis]GBC19480.2 hypothetical protein RIR_jg41745.t1 [Rhizophagus irregularis DAOM 181602=DAOM 197198]CAG8644905.1 18434_t:CDS:2 [Rhizophagus irregularis]
MSVSGARLSRNVLSSSVSSGVTVTVVTGATVEVALTVVLNDSSSSVSSGVVVVVATGVTEVVVVTGATEEVFVDGISEGQNVISRLH